MAEDFVLRVKEVHIACRHDRLSEFLAEPDNRPVEAAQFFLVLGKPLVEHEAVVADGLNLQKVIEACDTLEFCPAFVVQDCLKQFARLAGRADNQALTPLQQFGLRHNGHALEVFEIAIGNQPVEIAQADGIFGKDDDMPRTAVENFAAGAQLLHARVDLLKRVQSLLLHHLEKAHEQIPAGDRVVGGAVMVEIRQTQCIGDNIQLILAEFRHQILCQNERIDIGRMEWQAQSFARRRHEADIKVRVVRAQGAAADVFQEFRQCLGNIRLPGEHLVVDACQIDDLRLQGPVRVNEGLERAENLVSLHDGRADLDDRVMKRGQAGRFQVERDVFLVKGKVPVPVDGNAVIDVVDVVALAAVENFDVLVCSRDLGFGGSLHRVRERLCAAVIGDGDGAVAPAGCTLDGGSGIGQRIHGGHSRMQVQFDALFGVSIAALGRLDLFHGVRLKHHFIVIPVKTHLALYAQPHAGLNVVDDGLGLCGLHKLIDTDGTGIVRHIKADDPRAALFQFPVLHGEDLALDDHAEHVEIQFLHPDGLACERAAVEQRTRRLCRCGRACAGGLCAALRCAGRNCRRIFERLGADTRRLLKQCPAL